MQRQISNHLTATLARLDWEGLDGIPLALSSLDMVIMGIGDVIAVCKRHCSLLTGTFKMT